MAFHVLRNALLDPKQAPYSDDWADPAVLVLGNAKRRCTGRIWETAVLPNCDMMTADWDVGIATMRSVTTPPCQRPNPFSLLATIRSLLLDCYAARSRCDWKRLSKINKSFKCGIMFPLRLLQVFERR